MIGLGNLCQWGQLLTSSTKSSDQCSSWKIIEKFRQRLPWWLSCVKSKILDKEPHFTDTKNHPHPLPLWNVSWNVVSRHNGGCSCARWLSIHDQCSRYSGRGIVMLIYPTFVTRFFFFWVIAPNFSRIFDWEKIQPRISINFDLYSLFCINVTHICQGKNIS